MKVLWFTNTPSLYDQGKHYYHGGGWIESLETLLCDQILVELGISFFHSTDEGKHINGKTTYYPIKKEYRKKKPVNAIVNNWQGKIDDPTIRQQLLKVVQDFAPDIIHVFGTEDVFASIQMEIDIPVVIHLQGLLNPYYNTYFGVNQSKWNYLLDIEYLKNNIIGNSPAFTVKKMRSQAKREAVFLKEAKYIMGRTNWDEMVAKIYNPDVNYFHVDEVLRPDFYKPQNEGIKKIDDVLRIVSTLSPTVYKGIDVVLKAAKLLKDQIQAKFVWKIVGLENDSLLVKHFEKDLQLSCNTLNIEFVGRKDPQELITLLQESDVFVHPSYIDNSPNSVCEAQILGLPVIACAVGGLASLIEHEKSGILVPSNGVFEIVHYLRKYTEQPDKFKIIGSNAQKIAQERHNREKILNDLLNVYNKLIA